ncbi:hypothetical protein ETI06_05700 [Macrococcoides goetzii]|nr:hypothetical protein [Macrococcus goetzii]TDM49967.1 hypothetical protein ETI06_05700 [Macrococcus goetzii]
MKQIRVILEGKWIVDRVLPDKEVDVVVDTLREGMMGRYTSMQFDKNKYIDPSKIVAIEVNEVEA